MRTRFLWKDNNSQVQSCPSLTDTDLVPAEYRGPSGPGFAVVGIDPTPTEHSAITDAAPEIHIDPWERMVWIPSNVLLDHLPELIDMLDDDTRRALIDSVMAATD